jgi:hypothetical protein
LATNWLAWKNRISNVVEANNWKKYIDGTLVAPAASIAMPASEYLTRMKIHPHA